MQLTHGPVKAEPLGDKHQVEVDCVDVMEVELTNQGGAVNESRWVVALLKSGLGESHHPQPTS